MKFSLKRIWVWYNGITRGLGPCNGSSILSTQTRKKYSEIVSHLPDDNDLVFDDY